MNNPVAASCGVLNPHWNKEIMVTKKQETVKMNVSEPITFRGNRAKWLDFVYTTKKRGNKNVWSVIEKVTDEYIKKGENQ